MTDQDFAQLQKLTYRDFQDENGIDVTQIDHLLSLSPTDRLRMLEAFIETMVSLEQSREAHDSGFETIHHPSIH